MVRLIRENNIKSKITLDDVYEALYNYAGKWTNPKTGWTGECEVYVKELDDGSYKFDLIFGDNWSEPDITVFSPDSTIPGKYTFAFYPYHGEFKYCNTIKELRDILRREYSYLKRI